MHYTYMSREQLGRLWDEITPKLFGYLVNTLRDRAIAEDILQTTWMKALQGLPKYQDRGGRFSAWLFAIARNECKGYWRKDGREVPLEVIDHDMPDEQALGPQDAILAEQILSKLSEDDRELLRLRYIADLSLDSIASLLHLNFVTVRVRVHRALARARVHAVTQ